MPHHGGLITIAVVINLSKNKKQQSALMKENHERINLHRS